MNNEMIHTNRVLIVEGKYDAARLSHLTDAMILLTDGHLQRQKAPAAF